MISSRNLTSFDEICRRPFLYFLLSFICLFAIYSASFHTHYLLKDDYTLLKQVHDFPERNSFFIDIQQGRFINAFFTNWNVYKLLNYSENGKWFRLFSLIILSYIATLFSRLLFGSIRDSIQQLILPLCLILLLPFQIIALWVALMGSALALVFSILAFAVFWRFCGPDSLRCSVGSLAGFLCAFAFELIALNMYEPFAMFFWTMPALVLILNDSQYIQNAGRWRRSLVLYTLVGFFSMLVRFLLPKIILPLINCAPYERTQTIINSFPELLGRLWWFLQEPFIRGLNFWNFPNRYTTSIVCIIIFIGMLIETFHLFKRTQPNILYCIRIQTEKYAIIAALIILSFFPNIVVSSCEPRYRTFIAFTPILYLLFWIGCVRTVQFLSNRHEYVLRILSGTLLTMSIYSATANSCFVASQNGFDRRYMESKVNAALLNNKAEEIEQFHITVFGSRYKTVKHRLEFGYLTSEVGYHAVGMLCDILYSKELDSRRYKFSSSSDKNKPDLKPGVVIIDMASIKNYFTEADP